MSISKMVEHRNAFKMMNHYLNLERETQLLDFDRMLDHITIVMRRYVFLDCGWWCHDDSCAWLALDKVRAIAIIVEDAVLANVDAVMSLAVSMIQTGKRLTQINDSITDS